MAELKPSPTKHDLRVYDIKVDPRRYLGALLVPAVLLLGCHTLMVIYHYQIAKVHRQIWLLFDMDRENNLPTWFSGFLLLNAFFILWIIANKKNEAHDRWARHWRVLALGFLLMSIDEIAGIHETINTLTVPSWVFGGAILVMVIGIAFIPFLLHLPRQTGFFFGVAGVFYLLGAIVLEALVEAPIEAVDSSPRAAAMLRDNMAHHLMTMAEEGLEIFAIILFVHTLLDYMSPPEEKTAQASFEILPTLTDTSNDPSS